MKDFLNNDLNVGDTVVITMPNYREFVKAEVIRFTPKKVVVKYKMQNSSFDYITNPDFCIKI